MHPIKDFHPIPVILSDIGLTAHQRHSYRVEIFNGVPGPVDPPIGPLNHQRRDSETGVHDAPQQKKRHVKAEQQQNESSTADNQGNVYDLIATRSQGGETYSHRLGSAYRHKDGTMELSLNPFTVLQEHPELEIELIPRNQSLPPRQPSSND
jgi:hypothetical protein